jgi:hypothetical protein
MCFFAINLCQSRLNEISLPKKLPATDIAQRSTTLFDFRLWATPVAGFPVAKIVPPSNNPFVFFVAVLAALRLCVSKGFMF